MSTEIKFSLPFCLYRIDERTFNLGDKFNTEIKFIKQKIEPSRRTDRSVGMEFIRDRWGIDAISKVIIKTDKKFKEIDGAKNFTLEIANNFIKFYRYFDEDAVHLVNIIKEDLFEFLITEGKKFRMMITPGGGVATINPEMINKISSTIEKNLISDFQIPFWEELLINARHYIFVGEFRMSILESVIALELVLSDFIRAKCKKKEIPKKDAEKYIKDIGLSGNIKVSVRLLADCKELPGNAIFDKCKSGITIRNAIVHKGKKDASEREAKETWIANNKMIRFLLSC